MRATNGYLRALGMCSQAHDVRTSFLTADEYSRQREPTLAASSITVKMLAGASSPSIVQGNKGTIDDINEEWDRRSVHFRLCSALWVLAYVGRLALWQWDWCCGNGLSAVALIPNTPKILITDFKIGIFSPDNSLIVRIPYMV